jgi:probable phosphoglycerate mutase
MLLYVARHGETDWNVQGRYQGSADMPLNAKGFMQAEELARRLEGVDFDVIISSPLIRALRTAEVIQKASGKPLIVMEQFAERGMGVYEGLTRAEAQACYPDIFARLGSRRDTDDAPTGGETIRQVDTRVSSGLETLKEKYPGGKVLIVCHGFTARAINRCCLGLSFEDMHGFILNNCEYVTYEI